MSEMTVDNLYEILGIQPSAGAEEIKAAVKKTRRTWMLRQNAPVLQRRQEAETILEQVAEAERILLRPELRAAFDQQLQARTEAGQAAQPSEGPNDWLTSADEALQQGDASRAAWAAREATHLAPQDAEAWALRGRADIQLGRLQDAKYELERASHLDPHSAERHYELGWILQTCEEFGSALREYGIASQLAPGEPFYQIARGRALIDSGNPAGGVQELEPLAQEHADDWVQQSLAWGLCEAGLKQWQRMPNGNVLCLTKEAADSSLAMWRRAQELRFDDSQLRERLNELMSEAEHALAKRWAMSDKTFGSLLALTLIITFMFSASSDVLAFLALCAGAVGFIVLGRKPNYALDAKEAERRYGIRV